MSELQRVRGASVREGDWATLNEVVRDLTTAVNRVVDEMSGPADYSVTITIPGQQTTIGVALDGPGDYSWSISGIGAGATIFMAAAENGTVSWTNWQFTTAITRTAGSGLQGALGFASATDRFAMRGMLASTANGHVYSGVGHLSLTTLRAVSGQSPTSLGKVLRFSGGFKAGTRLTVRRVA